MRAQRSVFSPLWHRVENLRPRLHPQTMIERQVIRGEVWYVVKGRISNRVHRISASVYAVLLRLNGRRTVADVWEQVVDLFDEDAPSQDQLIQLLSQLYTLDLLQMDQPVDLSELTERTGLMRRRQAIQQFQNPLFFKLPLFDPDHVLDATMHLVRPLISPLGALIWLGAIGWFLAQVALNWESLTSNMADRVLAIDNIFIILVVFPVLKILHELAHAYATKWAKGEVHEVGIFFLILMPAPYVDASDSAAFPRKRDRIFVAAAGMIAELFVAAIAMLVWRSVEPGIVHSIAYNTILIASVSTIAFNGNPLLRFDAYHILCDLIEIPNLASRATLYYGYLVQRYIFGIEDARDPVSAKGEALWFIIFAPASLTYRLFVLFGIVALIGTQFFFVGVALAIWTVILAIVWPVMKMLKFVLISPAVARHRVRAVALTFGGLGLAAAFLFTVPVPHGTVARAIVWIPEEARVYAGTNGVVQRLLATPGSNVSAGDPLVELVDPYIRSQRARFDARVAELERRLMAAEAATPYDMQVLRKQLDFARDERAETDRKTAALVVRANAAGVFTVPRPADLIDTYAKKGQLLAYVLPEDATIVRAVLPEADIDTVRGQTKRLAIRRDGDDSQIIEPTPVMREVPGASRKLPSTALAQSNGGPFPLDPTAKENDVSLTPFFEIDIKLSHGGLGPRWEERVWVRFDHGASPVVERIYRSVRQVFLKQFNV